MGEFLADRWIETEGAKALLPEIDAVVPVPLHFRRRVQRGYNQAEVIARQISWRCGMPLVHAIRRTRDTETQTHLHSHEKRAANIRGAFALRHAARRIKGGHVLVIDDVLTTGSTLSAAAQVLKQAEPASLCALAIAIADPRRRGFETI